MDATPKIAGNEKANRLIHVVAAVIDCPKRGIFLAKRPDDKHQGGLWEFPGGKVESNETPLAALNRELEEEVGISVLESQPLIQVPYHYPDKSVYLDVYRVTQFSGEPRGNEGQKTAWVARTDLDNYAFPAANKPILNAVLLPDHIYITPKADSVSLCCQQIETAVAKHKVQQVMLRQKQLSDAEFSLWCKTVSELSNELGFKLVINSSIELANQLYDACSVDRLHLTSARLHQLNDRSDFKGRFLSASCHTSEELKLAVSKGCDFATLSPIKPTQSHPDTIPMGWDKAAELIGETPLPIYLLGGMQLADKGQAKRLVAQGIAAISAWL